MCEFNATPWEMGAVNWRARKEGTRSTARQTGSMHLTVARALAAIAMIYPLVAHSQNDTDQLAVIYDKLTAVKKLPPKSDADPVGQIECTYYQDIMVRETATDTPDPNNATLVPVPVGASRPACDAAHRPGDITLKTGGFGFVGRKGPFLIFSAADPNGAVPFKVIDASNGRVIYSDGTAADRGIHAATVENGKLHLRYTHGFNASCSIMQNAAACWSSLIGRGQLPRAMAKSVPSLQVCTESYRAEKAPADDPSVITYDLDIIIDATGKTEVLSRGAVGCMPVP